MTAELVAVVYRTSHTNYVIACVECAVRSQLYLFTYIVCLHAPTRPTLQTAPIQSAVIAQISSDRDKYICAVQAM